MSWVDLIGYAIIILLVVITLYIERKHFVCDGLNCDVARWAEERSASEKDTYVEYVRLQTRPSVWMRSFLLAVIITAFVYWWFCGRLPSIINFIVLFAVIFIVIYFGSVFYQHHFNEPLNRRVIKYMETNCS